MKKLEKYFFIAVIINIFILIISANNNKEQEYFNISKRFLENLISNNYFQATKLMSSELKQALNKNSFEQTSSYLNSKFGKPINFIFISLNLYKDFHLIYIKVEHQKAFVIYQFAIDKNFQIAGFYIKKVEQKK